MKFWIKKILFSCIGVICVAVVLLATAKVYEQRNTIMFDEASDRIMLMFPSEVKAIEENMGRHIEKIDREVLSVIRDMLIARNTTDQYQSLRLEELLNQISLGIAEFKDANHYSEFP